MPSTAFLTKVLSLAASGLGFSPGAVVVPAAGAPPGAGGVVGVAGACAKANDAVATRHMVERTGRFIGKIRALIIRVRAPQARTSSSSNSVCTPDVIFRRRSDPRGANSRRIQTSGL